MATRCLCAVALDERAGAFIKQEGCLWIWMECCRPACVVCGLRCQSVRSEKLRRIYSWGGSIEWKGQKILRVCLSAKISRIWLQIHVFAPKISRICPFAFCPVSAHASCRDSSPLQYTHNTP